MNVHVQYHNCPHSEKLQSYIEEEIKADSLLQKEFFTSVKCFISKEHHSDQDLYIAKIIVHNKHHEDFACHLSAQDPYSPWGALLRKVHHHFEKLFR